MSDQGTGTTGVAPEDRLEAALERIAQHLEAPDPIAAEVAARLDRMIDTVRATLDS